MGELFAREQAREVLDFTGERMVTGHSGQVEYEHLHRYFFAREFCRDKDVLDVAAGEGFGGAYLAQHARSVVGVEASAETVAHAEASYPRPNLSFRQGDARRLAFADASFDVVTSFETIEHFFEQVAFLDEVRRVLRPGGLFFVSSPDRDVYSPLGGPVNPFHVKELSRQEFGALLRARFAHCDFYAQRPMTGTVLLAEAPHEPPDRGRTFERRGDAHFEACEGLPRAPYVVAVASNAAIPAGFDSVFIETSDTDGPRRRIAALEAARAEELAAIRVAHADETRRMAADHAAQTEKWLGRITDLQRDLAIAARATEAATRAAEDAAARAGRIEGSASWRLTGPLRRVARALRG